MHVKPLKALLVPITVLCAVLCSLHAQGMDLYNVFDAEPPRVTHEGVLFTFKPGRVMPRYVMVSGSFDNWQTAHMMVKNEHGIFSYLYHAEGTRGVILDARTYQYRYLVDGVWITDPVNPRTEYDRYGTPLSTFSVGRPIIKRQKNPVHVKGTVYVFYFDDPYARQVLLVGDFNNWNPYSHPLKKNRAGLWEIEIDLPPGEYSYRFIVDGKHTVDPLGLNIRYDRFDRELTHLLIPLERMEEEEEKTGIRSLVFQ
jgi:1,4-alpha-glucan branching enzyme